MDFFEIFWITFKVVKVTTKITEVTTEQRKRPEIITNSMTKNLGQNSPQELEVSSHCGLYLLADMQFVKDARILSV